VNYNEIVPDDIQAELIAIRDSVTQNCWRVGDICTGLQKFHERMQIMVGKMDLYKAVGVFSGKSGRTVREYAFLAEFYPAHIRREYEVLSYDHFRTAAKLGPDHWQEALEWCVAQVDTLGRPASVDAMEAKFGLALDQAENGQAVNMPDQDGEAAYDIAVDKSCKLLMRYIETIKQITMALDATPEEYDALDKSLGTVEKVAKDIVLRQGVLT
jgi:hypothetical protein